ncbi:hypothetical protein PR202_gb19762 [Eleusine coracana subsp. coracana]|uniref:PRC-barrel domain-containing protein n=1 Tax=Eleusine coracana subsp. coracana TaxID=191504 RepID=A0AAV5F9P4_ELECO|nr:hypothetical protein PR202_gb19762 [Eleusine coracana subsp. coracana]
MATGSASGTGSRAPPRPPQSSTTVPSYGSTRRSGPSSTSSSSDAAAGGGTPSTSAAAGGTPSSSAAGGGGCTPSSSAADGAGTPSSSAPTAGGLYGRYGNKRWMILNQASLTENLFKLRTIEYKDKITVSPILSPLLQLPRSPPVLRLPRGDCDSRPRVLAIAHQPVRTMCSCACARLSSLPHPLFRSAPNPKPRPVTPRDPFLARHALVACAAARDDEPAPPSSFDFLALKRELEQQEEAVVSVEAEEGAAVEGDGERGAEKGAGGAGTRRPRRQMARRSALLAKQVICVRSARSLGFVSQLWVDSASVCTGRCCLRLFCFCCGSEHFIDDGYHFWLVALVEVRPSLLSGEAEKFLFEDIYQVGDVVLVEDESVIDYELKLAGLHSLVGYNVVTSRRRNVGKVRGFTFDMNSGAMESLELDSFGFSIVPSSLVSTYCLFVEDVLDIVSDTIVVHEDAISRVQRLTQGILGTQNIGGPGGEVDEYGRFERRRASSQGKSGGRKLRRKMRDPEDEWELPMDY